jgi:cyclohexadienyl dehydratase
MARTLQTRVAESLESLVIRLWPIRAAELRACVTDRITRRSRWSRELRRRHYLASSRWSRSRLRPISAAELALAALIGLVSARLVFAGEPVLRVGTSDDYPPFSLRGRGFDVDAAEAMARDFGMRIEWVRFRWPELRGKMRADVFDVAMSGITWRPERAVIGWMSRAVAQGGPCVVGDPNVGLVAVNRGGVLESWARRRFAPRSIVSVDDNLSLPTLLESGAVSAFVTDSFEAASRPRGTDHAVSCEPPRDRKVYWIAPQRASALGPRVDAWVAANETHLEELRRRWLGGTSPRDEVDNLIDLAARRLALMPAVAAWKHAHGIAVENPAREQAVLARAEGAARAAGLDPDSVRSLFSVQIALAKALERRASETEATLDLETEIRPALSQIGDRIVASLAVAAPVEARALAQDRLAPLAELLSSEEVGELRTAILGVRRSKS